MPPFNPAGTPFETGEPTVYSNQAGQGAGRVKLCEQPAGRSWRIPRVDDHRLPVCVNAGGTVSKVQATQTGLTMPILAE